MVVNLRGSANYFAFEPWPPTNHPTHAVGAMVDWEEPNYGDETKLALSDVDVYRDLDSNVLICSNG